MNNVEFDFQNCLLQYSTLHTSVFIFAFPAPSINEVVCVLIGSNTRTRYPYPDRQANPLFFPEPKDLLSSYLIRPCSFVRGKRSHNYSRANKLTSLLK